MEGGGVDEWSRNTSQVDRQMDECTDRRMCKEGIFIEALNNRLSDWIFRRFALGEVTLAGTPK